MATPGVDLVRRLAAGDRAAFAPFYDRYAPLVYPVVLRIVRDRADASDVVQEVFWEAWQTAASSDPERGTPEAWLLTRARSRAIDRARSVRRAGETSGAPVDESLAATAVEAADAADPISDHGRVRAALAALPDAQREAVELACWNGLTQTQIADRLKQPLGTVRTWIRLGLERLRDALRET